MANNVKGTALITGASSGIGAVYADRFAHRGHDLILVARDAARMEGIADRLRAETGHTVEVLPADLTVHADVAKIESRLAGDPTITVLVNNAGISLSGGLLQNAATELEKLIAVNIMRFRNCGRGWNARGFGRSAGFRRAQPDTKFVAFASCSNGAPETGETGSKNTDALHRASQIGAYPAMRTGSEAMPRMKLA